MKQDTKEKLKNKFRGIIASPKKLAGAVGTAAVVIAAVTVIAQAGYRKDGFDPNAYSSDSSASNDVAYDTTVFGADQNQSDGKEMDQNSQEDVNLDEGEDPLEEQQQDNQLLISDNTGTNSDPNSNSGVQGVSQGDGNSTPVVVTNPGSGDGTSNNGGNNSNPTTTPAAAATPAPNTTTTPAPTKVPGVTTPTPTQAPTPVPSEWELTGITAGNSTGKKTINVYKYMTLTENELKIRVDVYGSYQKRADHSQTKTEKITDFNVSMPLSYVNKEMTEADLNTIFPITVSYGGYSEQLQVLVNYDYLVYKKVSITYNEIQKYCTGEVLSEAAKADILSGADITVTASSFYGHVKKVLPEFQKTVEQDKIDIVFHNSDGSTTDTIADTSVVTADLKIKDTDWKTFYDTVQYQVYAYKMNVNDYNGGKICDPIYQNSATFNLLNPVDGQKSPYNLMIERLKADGSYPVDEKGNPTSVFTGWSIYMNEDDADRGVTTYTITGTSHVVTMWPVPLKKIDQEYEIRTEGNEQILVGYMGTDNVLNVPKGVTILQMDDSFDISAEESEKVTTLVIPSTVHEIDFSAMRKKFPNLEAYQVEEGNPMYSSDSTGALYTDKGKTLLRLPPKASKNYTVPYEAGNDKLTVTKIAEGALDDILATLSSQNQTMTLGLENPVPPVFTMTKGLYKGKTNLLRICVPDSQEADMAADCYLKYYGASWGQTLDESFDKDGIAMGQILYTSANAQEKYKNTGNTVYSQNGAVKTLEFVPVDAPAVYTVPAAYTAIAGYAFDQSEKVTTVKVPAGMCQLMDYAFADSQKNHLNTIEIQGDENIVLGSKLAGETDENQDSSILRFYITQAQEDNSHWRSSFEEVYGDSLTAQMLVIGDNTLEYIDDCVYLKNKTTGELTLYSVPVDKTDYTAPEYLTAIAPRAFYGCQITTLDLPEVTYVAENAFLGCSKLEVLALTASDTVLVEDDFAGCDRLDYVISYHAENLTVPQQTKVLTENAYTLSDKIIYQNVDQHQEVVYGATDIEGMVTLKDDTTKIQNDAFTDCILLKGFEQEQWNRITEIGAEAFRNCKALTVDPQSSDTSAGVLLLTASSIGDYAFQGCTSIQELYLNQGVSTLGERVFADCENLSGINWIGDTTQVGDYLFENCGRIQEVNIGDSSALEYANPVTSIGNYTFANCTSMAYLNMYTSMIHIGDYAFYGCETMQLYDHQYDDGMVACRDVMSIGDYAFANCKKVTSGIMFRLSDKLTSYGIGTFMNCEGILSGDLPQYVTEIPDYCFAGCSKIKFFNLFTEGNETTKLERIGVGAFTGCTNMSRMYGMSYCTQLTEIDDYAFSAVTVDGTEYKACTKLIDQEYPSSLVSIGTGAYEDCTALENINFYTDKSLTTIETRAYANCTSLQEINMEVTALTQLNAGVFTNCSSLSAAFMPKTLKNIQKQALEGCDRLATVRFRTQEEVQIETGALGDTADNEGLIIYVLATDDHSLRDAYINDPLWQQELKGRQEEVILELDGGSTVYEGALYTSDGKDGLILTNVFPTTSGAMRVATNTSSITPDAFKEATKVTMVIMPDNISEIPDGIFTNCTSLEALIMRKMSDTTDAQTLSGTLFGDGTPNENFRIYTEQEMMDEYRDWGAPVYSYGYDFTIDSNVLYGKTENEVGDSEITLLYIPRSYEGGLTLYVDNIYVEASAGEGCTSLTSITVNVKTKSIGKRAFAGCTALEWLYAANTTNTKLTTIGEEAFMDCTALTGAYSGGASRLYLPASVRYIEKGAFKNCTSLSYFSMQGLPTEIADETFYGCTKLATYSGQATSLAAIKRIGKKAFYGCTSVTSISWTNMTNLTEVDDSAYEGCSNLILATFADKLTRIGDRAFMGTQLYSISFNGCEPPVLGDSIMEESLQADIDIFVPQAGKGTVVPDTYYAAWKNTYPVLAERIQGMEGDAFRMVSNVLYLVNPSNVKQLTAIKVPKALKTVSFYNVASLYCIGIADKALAGCNQITKIVVTSNIQYIGNNAFEDCTALDDVTIGNAVTTIGTQAFLNCRSVTELYLPAGITSLGDRMLEGAANVSELWVDETEIPPALGEKLFGDELPANVKIYVPQACYTSYVERWGAILDRDYGPGTAEKVLTYEGKPEAQALVTPTPTVTPVPTATPAPTLTPENNTTVQEPAADAAPTPEATPTPGETEANPDKSNEDATEALPSVTPESENRITVDAVNNIEEAQTNTTGKTGDTTGQTPSGSPE